MRLVEYAPFPRVRSDQRWQHGFTLDLSSRGLCVRAKEVAPVGSLLRIIVRSVDGRPVLDAVGRVAWAVLGPTGAARMGLEIVASREDRPPPAAPRRVRAAAHRARAGAPLAVAS